MDQLRETTPRTNSKPKSRENDRKMSIKILQKITRSRSTLCLAQNSLIHLHLKGILGIPIDNRRLCYRNKLIVNHLRRIHFYDRTIKNKSGVIFADHLFHNTRCMKNSTFFDIHENNILNKGGIYIRKYWINDC